MPMRNEESLEESKQGRGHKKGRMNQLTPEENCYFLG
jgi:hypothetical protein